ncbi:acyl-CoA dehydrogenase family protein [Nocardia sp. CS682]|uniref:acyl-CoA dehydrogenase family protein n=1 Tax=Nocardia sp. CS682 TaxID=1047172 RepID=UPI001F0D22D9|nr:acyl-CoA dehydrogenase family protein [Nocardia sp. CS682]
MPPTEVLQSAAAADSTAPAATGTVASALRRLADSGRLELPPPGSGRTIDRWRTLADFTFGNVVVGRMVEAHADAAAILAELGGGVVERGQIWGVWAAEPPKPVLQARFGPGGWTLDGRKPWCSGATICTHALVTARAGEERRLFAVDLGQPSVRPVPGSWHAVGMRESDSGAVDFHAAAAEPVGGPGTYLARPGFWHGAMGVAACWYGGASAVARTLHDRATDEHALAHLGAVMSGLQAAALCLTEAAHQTDADPTDRSGTARLRARTVRAVVEDAATAALDRVGRALGAAPLCADADHAQRVADLTVYLRQSHAERDLAQLGRDYAEREYSWLPNR